jgi:hypothetical protein
VTITFNHISLQHVFNIIPLLSISRLLACKYSFTRNLSSAYQRKNGMHYRSRCNIFNSFVIALLFRYIYKGRLVKISENIALLFYKEIYMKYLILYYKIYLCIMSVVIHVHVYRIFAGLVVRFGVV